MIRWLDTVRFDNLSGAMIMAAIRVNDVYEANGIGACWITSGSDGVHNSGSVHGEGLALDFRTKNIRTGNLGNTEEMIFEQVRDALGPAYFVKLEKVGDTPETSAQHLHVQYNERKNNILEP